MSRTERLLTLMQILRQYRSPVSGEKLSQKLGVSIRTLYRDIATLKGQGAEIEGEPGLGYILKPGFFLPPLMFSETEMESILLGIQWVQTFGDKPLSSTAKVALSKIVEVLPKAAKNSMNSASLRVGPPPSQATKNEDLSSLRQAIRTGLIIEFEYISSRTGKEKHYKVCPFTIGYFPDKRILVAWDDKKQEFIYFQTSEINRLKISNKRYSERREILFKKWQTEEIKKYQ